MNDSKLFNHFEIYPIHFDFHLLSFNIYQRNQISKTLRNKQN